ncbi:MAG TPA: tRNA pseudouridine(38-40) synthase TruA [Candidatus Tectomicrobia bacterium]
MRTLKLVIEYDGFDYHGWQVQDHAVTIQGVIEAALEKILGEPIRVNGAGRTDAKVHALGQVASLRCPTDIPTTALQRALNAVLPRDIVVHEVRDVPADFHARFSALGKVYVYRILNRPVRAALRLRYVWHLPHALDVPSMALAGTCLQGTHDFTSFQGTGSEVRTTERTLTELTVACTADEIVITCTANGFLRHMVRNIVGTLVEVGRGARPPADLKRILDGRDRRLAGATAPPQGLYLTQVLYP